MRLELVDQGHIFAGTPRQILMQMKSLAPGAAHLTLREYVDGNLANIGRGGGNAIELPAGDDDDALAEAFVQRMIEGGYARRL
jgi:hypothetical protein